MVTNDEKSEFDNSYFKAQNNKSPSWEEIESLLKFAEKLKTESDALYDSVFLISWFQIVATVTSFFVFVFLLCQITTFSPISGVYLSSDFIWGAIGLFFLLICLVSSEIYLRKIRRRIKSESRALGSIIDLLRENSLFITSNLSDLQKFQLKIHTSRFDIGIASSIPMPWAVNLIKLFFHGLPR